MVRSTDLGVLCKCAGMGVWACRVSFTGCVILRVLWVRHGGEPHCVSLEMTAMRCVHTHELEVLSAEVCRREGLGLGLSLYRLCFMMVCVGSGTGEPHCQFGDELQ
jgi:hypothetical protein